MARAVTVYYTITRLSYEVHLGIYRLKMAKEVG